MEKIDQSKFQRLTDDDRTSEFIARPVVTYWSDAWRRFKENKAALVAFIILVFLIVMVIIGPMLTGYSHEQLVGDINLTPSSKFWFGTDELGRDIFTRIWRGGRISIIIGLAGAIIGTVIGSIYGSNHLKIGFKLKWCRNTYFSHDYHRMVWSCKTCKRSNSFIKRTRLYHGSSCIGSKQQRYHYQTPYSKYFERNTCINFI